MKIDVSEISRYDGAVHDINIAEIMDDIVAGDETISFGKPVEFNGRLVNANGILKLDGRLKADYTVKCYRCLNDISTSIDLDIREDFLKTAADADDEVFTYEDGMIDLGRVLKENIILNLPMKQLCSKSCKGLCPRCGMNLNLEECSCSQMDEINPKMDKLKDFFKD